MDMDIFMKCAVEEAEAGLREGGIPIGRCWCATAGSSGAAGTAGSRLTIPYSTPRLTA
ncbi:hypothetical protein [Methanoculleus chikugoensis]|uniref:hypothetical protein n=1 Tax=Methanoculleus chikugoensis TaxID=118126 RepID=UPI001FB259D6|nr:hypothetical protein [Methanoculleus chikugoensis]